MSATKPPTVSYALDRPVRPSPSRSARTTIAASVGTIIEWYDYGLYGIVAGLVIAPVFFPTATGAVGVLATFATFAVGFAARPIGGIVLGAVADRWGRRPVLILTVVLVGVVTFLMGLLPGYAVIGVWAPALLVTLRVVQGFGAGAELAGAITILNESATRPRKGWYSALAMATGLGGSILATLLFMVISGAVSPDAFVAWGWRVPFLLSAVLTVVAIVLRSSMSESPEFERVQAERRAGKVRPAGNPLVMFARSVAASPRNWIAGLLLPSGLNTTGFVTLSYGISYLTTTERMPRAESLTVNLAMLVVGAVVCVLWGRAADRIGARRVMWIGIVGGVALAAPYVSVLQLGVFPLVLLMSMLLFAVAWSASAAAHAVLMPALFKADYRSSGLFSSRELQGALIAGPAPFVAAALVVATGSVWVLIAVLVAAQVLTVVGFVLAHPFVGPVEREETPALQGFLIRE